MRSGLEPVRLLCLQGMMPAMKQSVPAVSTAVYPAIATFSIVARDPETGDLGVATASKFLAVGAVVPFAKANVGAIATQSHANVSFSPRSIAALEQGIPPALIAQAFADQDPEHALRQYGIVDAQGRSVSITGDACHPWAGGISLDNLAAQGNLLAGSQVIDALVETFQQAQGALAERLLQGLAAADAAGGDKRGRQAAALLVVRQNGGYGGLNDRYIDLRCDDHSQPVQELQRLLELHRLYFEKPAAHDILTVDAALCQRLQGILQRSGYWPAEQRLETWDAQAQQALERLAGVENLEERMLETGFIDKTVLRYLEERFPA